MAASLIVPLCDVFHATGLTEPVDVYHEWLDELEAAHEEEFGDDAGYEAVGAS